MFLLLHQHIAVLDKVENGKIIKNTNYLKASKAQKYDMILYIFSFQL